MKLIFALAFMSLPTFFMNSNKELASTYINNFKDIAIEEMHRTGIPASIKLAQGLLESDWGRSDLAKTANNHFGIKCGRAWMGDTFYKKDDDKDEKGRLIKSCFRSFSSPLESYMAHSDFLSDPKKEYRYGFLFEYASTDYVSWAKGLKKSGYATDPKYPNKLIQIIKKYELDRFDELVAPNQFASRTASPTKANRTKKNHKKRSRVKKVKGYIEDSRLNTNDATPKTLPSKYVSRLKYEIEVNNNCRLVKAKGGESLEELAKAIGQSKEELLSFNEVYQNGDVILKEKDMIYLEKKKRSYRGDHEFHKVKEGETMESIAQLYGIRLKSLYAKNRMPKNSLTMEGVKLSIRKTVSLDERPKFLLNNPSRRHKFLFEGDEVVK